MRRSHRRDGQTPGHSPTHSETPTQPSHSLLDVLHVLPSVHPSSHPPIHSAAFLLTLQHSRDQPLLSARCQLSDPSPDLFVELISEKCRNF